MYLCVCLCTRVQAPMKARTVGFQALWATPRGCWEQNMGALNHPSHLSHLWSFTLEKDRNGILTSILCTWGIRLRSSAIPYLPFSSLLNGELWDEARRKSAQQCKPCSTSSRVVTTDRQVIPVTIASYFQGERKNMGWVHMVHRQRTRESGMPADSSSPSLGLPAVGGRDTGRAQLTLVTFPSARLEILMWVSSFSVLHFLAAGPSSWLERKETGKTSPLKQNKTKQNYSTSGILCEKYKATFQSKVNKHNF